LPNPPEKPVETQIVRPENGAEQSARNLDQRFYELAEELKRWSEETARIMRSETRQKLSTSDPVDLKTVIGFTTIFGKWSLAIVAILVARRRVRFVELRKALRGISSRVLSKKLRAMHDAGLIKRTIVDSRPPRVLYELRERGLTLVNLGRPLVLFLLAEADRQEPL